MPGPKPAVLRKPDLLFPDLSYRIVGTLFAVHNALGAGLYERSYQRAVASALHDAGITFREQVPISVAFRQQAVGKYIADFVIEGKIVLELKVGQRYAPKYIAQVVAYLRAMQLQLGILANFTNDGVMCKRILNILKPSDHS